MFALLEIARIYKALKLFADLQGLICYKDLRNKGINLLKRRHEASAFKTIFWPGQKSA